MIQVLGSVHRPGRTHVKKANFGSFEMCSRGICEFLNGEKRIEKNSAQAVVCSVDDGTDVRNDMTNRGKPST